MELLRIVKWIVASDIRRLNKLLRPALLSTPPPDFAPHTWEPDIETNALLHNTMGDGLDGLCMYVPHTCFVTM